MHFNGKVNSNHRDGEIRTDLAIKMEQILDTSVKLWFQSPIMRVRITQPQSGSIDGIQLSRFITGLTYEVGTTIGSYLLSTGAAVPVESDTPALVLPIHDVAEILFPTTPMSEAADRPPRKKARRKRS